MDFKFNQINYGDMDIRAHEMYLVDEFHREKERIDKEQKEMDESWEKELNRREKAGFFNPIGSMFEDGTSDQYNKKAQELMDRRENNKKKLEDLI